MWGGASLAEIEARFESIEEGQAGSGAAASPLDTPARRHATFAELPTTIVPPSPARR